MRKIVIHRPGGYEELRLEHCDDPVPTTGEALIDVAAAGVNYADCLIRMGFYKAASTFVGWPITPGYEIAGHIIALGEGTTGFKVGDAVVGLRRQEAKTATGVAFTRRGV